MPPFFKATMSDLILTDIQDNGEFVKFTHVQSIGEVLASNQELRKHTDEIWNTNKTIKPAATLPMATFLELQKNGIMNDPQLFFRWLEANPEYKVVNKTFAKRIQHF
jgi:hypothetical protein